MNFFNLPVRTRVGRVVPKNAFDNYTNTKQKKLFTDSVQRITWTHKLSSDTINLESKEINEIQIFKVELKEKSDILKLLEIINKSIPYHIVFWVEYNQEVYISTASKHPHPTNDDIAVIDWMFTSEWFKKEENHYSLNLKGSLDAVFKDLCVQIIGKHELVKESIDYIVNNQQNVNSLTMKISKLKAAISSSKQFNEKVELNLRLKAAERELAKIKS